ncbi:MAG: DNA replication/repair protein RecF [Thermoanaerobaculia bacterium]
MLETLHSNEFRNLAPEVLSFSPGTTLLFGENGHGKTNFLEALAVLSGRPSFRGARSAEMAAGDSFSLRAAVRNENGMESVSAEWSAGRARVFQRNGKRADFLAVGSALPAVFLAPEDRALFLGGPAVRRKFLDRLAVTIFPAAVEDYRKFQRCLDQRNALLASPGSPGLESWTEQFILSAARAGTRRLAALDCWKPHWQALLTRAGALSEIELRFSGPKGSMEDLAAEYRQQHARLARAERERGRTLFGPQRDAIEFERGGRPFGASASTGEVMRAAFLLRLSEGETVAAVAGKVPLYALDDFDAELSPGAAESLVAELPESAQTVLTTAHPETVSRCPRKPDLVYEVVCGRAQLQARRENLRKIG